MIAIGSDHGGFRLKNEIVEHFRAKGVEFQDFGTLTGESIDYPDVAEALCAAIVSGECERGILLCGTGLGINIAANKINGIRAAECHDTFSAQMSREHNDANVLTMGGRVVGPDLACAIVEKWLNSSFAGGRHARRVEKIMAIEAKN